MTAGVPAGRPSHTRRLPSFPTVTTQCPSGLNDASFTSVTGSVYTSVAVRVSRSRTVPSGAMTSSRSLSADTRSSSGTAAGGGAAGGCGAPGTRYVRTSPVEVL